MLEPILGNSTAEKVLLFILVHREAYARELAQTFGLPVSVIQKQLLRLERGGVLASQTKGRTRLFQLDPRYAFNSELQALLRRALHFLPPAGRAPHLPKPVRAR